MRNKRVKQIRKLFPDLEDPATKRVYRRFKKKYNSVPPKLREEFMRLAEKEFGIVGG